MAASEQTGDSDRQPAKGSSAGIGYVGLGDMGGALALRLQRSFPLLVYDIDPAAVDRLRADGATGCASLAELAERCDTILLCLPTSAHVRTAIFGPSGLAGSLRRGARLIDQSTGDPLATRTMAGELAERGVTLIDAPVSGGAAGAAAGTIAIMVGARGPELAAVHPILSAISPNIFACGDVGCGHVMKLANNLLSGAQRLLTLESVALAVKNGIDPAKAVEVLSAGGGRNAFLQTFMGPQLVRGDLGPNFSLGLMLKDVRLACDLASASGVPSFYGAVTRELYQLCISERGAADRVNAAALVFDRLAGTQVVPPAGRQRQNSQGDERE